ESGKLEFSSEPLSVAQVIGEAVATLGAAAVRGGLRVQTRVDPAADNVVGDALRLKQVLYNYLSNAIKFSESGGQIEVRAGLEGSGSIRIEVEDSGVGIKAEDLQRLFVEFQQLDSSSTKKHSGTGLGLALTKRIVEAQGGWV